ncbi:MAG: hypothetical protein ACP5JU_01945 [Minisyncoccia bacterium]
MIFLYFLINQTATSSLFIVNPFKDKKGFINWLGNLFSTHPPIEERIKRLKDMKI